MPASSSPWRREIAHPPRHGDRAARGHARATGGKEFVSFSCNDYLGLTHHPRVIAAAREALERLRHRRGRFAIGDREPPRLCRARAIARRDEGHRGASLVFSSGYLANVGVIPALVGKDDLIVADRLCHACMWDGARLSGAMVMRFDHNDLDHAGTSSRRTATKFGRCLILTESVFSMDGDRGPVGELSGLAREYDAWLMTDDAHGLGICSSEAADVQMGTLSKSVGSCGGYVCGPAELIAWLANRSRSLLFSTGLPPASVAAAVAALRIIRDDEDLRSEADGECQAVHGRARSPAGGQSNRARDRRRAEARAGGLVDAARAWPAGRRDPPADRSRPARHGSGSPSRRCMRPSLSSGLRLC